MEAMAGHWDTLSLIVIVFMVGPGRETGGCA